MTEPTCPPHNYSAPAIFDTRDGLLKIKKATSICSKCGDVKTWRVAV